MLAGALCRLAADVPKTSPHDMPQLVRSLGRTLLGRNAVAATAARTLPRAYASALYSRRTYATTARTTKPAAPVKKAVKGKAAAKPAPKKKAAPAKKTPARKPAAKKKAVAKKPKPRRVKKVLTAEEKEKAKIRELRVKALKEPVSQRLLTAFNVFVGEITEKGEGGSQNARLTDASRRFKDLAPAELEHYNRLAREKNAARKAEFQKWLNSYTPEQIRIANNARAQLRKKLAGKQKSNPAYTSKLQDERQASRPPNAYIIFNRARHATGDFKNVKTTEASKLIGAEWKALSENEKKKYEAEAKARASKQTAA